MNFDDVVLVIHENGYVDGKCEYQLLKELSNVSHDYIIRFSVAFTFQKPIRLILQMLGLSSVYNKNFSGGSLIQW